MRLRNRLFALLSALLIVTTVACNPPTSSPMGDQGGMNDAAQITAVQPFPVFTTADRSHGDQKWIAHITVDKRYSDDPAAPIYERIEADHNLLTTTGANTLWTGLSGGAITAYNATNTYLGVGDSTTAASAGQTDLQASTNKLRKQVSGAPTVSTNQISWSATFGTSDANYAWAEWAVFNAASGGTMLNRAIPAGTLGTKTSAASWTLTVTLSLS